MIERVEQTIRDNNLICIGDTVLCAVSGGADSVALLHCLCLLSKKLGFTLEAAHFNHCIRGDAADADENFVCKLCEDLNVKCYFGKADVPKYAKDHGYTCEQAGRILRYEFFATLHTDKIAVAHHMDDQVESVMMHISRGSGTSGLCGMRYSRDNIIRPLLNVRRSTIETYIKQNNLSFCTDTTNFIEDGTRNKLRLSIIPEITEKINPRFTESVCAMADIVRADDDYLNSIAASELKKCVRHDGYDREKLSKLELPIRRRAIILAMHEAGAFADIEQKHVDIVENLLHARTGAVTQLPHIVAYTSYDKICFAPKDEYLNKMHSSEYCIEYTGKDVHVPQGVIRVRYITGNSIHMHNSTSYIDANKLPESCVVRSRRPGDRITPIGSSGSKKLKDFFIDKKIDRSERNMPLICCDSEVLCIVGVMVAKSVMVTSDTASMAEISFIKED